MLRKLFALLLSFCFLIIIGCKSNDVVSEPTDSSADTSENSFDEDDFWNEDVVGNVESSTTQPQSSKENTVSKETITQTNNEEKDYEMKQASNKYSKYISYRSALPNTYKKLSEKKELTIIYYGGSVTDGGGNTKCWRELVGKWFIENFPNAKIDNMSRAIGGTGSRFGLYRLNRDVLPYKPDLMFIEFAINDYYSPESTTEAKMLYETLVREIKQALPECEIVTVLTTEKAFAGQSYSNLLYAQAEAHDDISYFYNIPTVKVGNAAVNEIGEKYADKWSIFFRDIVHPVTEGHKLYFNCLEEFLVNTLLNTKYNASAYEKKELPSINSVELFDGNRTYVEITKQILDASNNLGGSGFAISNNKAFESSVPHGFIEANTDNAKFCFEFTGTEFAVALSKETDIKVTVDGKMLENITKVKAPLPQTLVKDLPSAKHTVMIEIPQKNTGIYSVMYRDVTKATK